MTAIAAGLPRWQLVEFAEGGSIVFRSIKREYSEDCFVQIYSCPRNCERGGVFKKATGSFWEGRKHRYSASQETCR